MAFDVSYTPNGNLKIVATAGDDIIVVLSFRGRVIVGGKDGNGPVPLVVAVPPRFNIVYVEAKAGNDIIVNGSAFKMFAKGGPGTDIIVGGPSFDRLEGDGDVDLVFGRGAKDHIWGGQAPDWVFGGKGEDFIIGGPDAAQERPAKDRLFGGPDRDHLSGGEGPDRLWGGGAADEIVGDAGDDWLFGGAGNDRLLGGAGNDTLCGWTENDKMFAHIGDDRVFGEQGADHHDGGAGNDALFGNVQDGDTFANGAPFPDRPCARDGPPVSYLDSGVMVSVEDGVLSLQGTPQADHLELELGDGIVRLKSLSRGEAELLLPAPEERLTIGAELFEGHDTLRVTGTLELLVVSGGDGHDRIDASASAYDNAVLLGGADHDILVAGNGPTLLLGEEGDDSLTAGPSADFLSFTNDERPAVEIATADRLLDQLEGIEVLKPADARRPSWLLWSLAILAALLVGFLLGRAR